MVKGRFLHPLAVYVDPVETVQIVNVPVLIFKNQPAMHSRFRTGSNTKSN